MINFLFKVASIQILGRNLQNQHTMNRNRGKSRNKIPNFARFKRELDYLFNLRLYYRAHFSIIEDRMYKLPKSRLSLQKE